MGSGVNWSELPLDLLGQIAKRLPLIEDLMAFRGVCAGWKAAAPKEKLLSKVPFLMLSEKIGDSGEREFYSLYKRKICMRKQLPEIKSKRCIEVGFGCVLAFSPEGSMLLLKPLSTDPAVRFQLPSYKQVPGYFPFLIGELNESFVLRGMLTANPSETSNFKLLLGTRMGMAAWTHGDDDWTKISDEPRDMAMVLRRSDGKMYKLAGAGAGRVEIWGADFSEPEATVRVSNMPDFSHDWEQYLVESTDGELLLIRRNNAGPFDGRFEFGADHFGVMRVDLVKGECSTEIGGLGKDAIFVGHNHSVAVDATEFPGVLDPSCIYFTEDREPAYGGGKDMGIYNVKNATIQRFPVQSYSNLSPPLWVFPSSPPLWVFPSF